ncbi:unnamed protein product [Dovyalis caffra]|uniref:PORR domain-containing protein n=1 Tax=Dovyalis caffra TaxID=77055 RepID=A0AAV1SNR0_9ROSI|nr:unnamed protein product [Dovyalis caffra]
MVTRMVRTSILISKFNESQVFVYLPVRRNWQRETLLGRLQSRLMTTSKRVQDRSKTKRVHDLEIVTEKWKIVSKVMAVMEILKEEPEFIIPVRNLERYRAKINLPKPHKISDFLRKSPKLFELYKDRRGVLWCGMTKEAEDLVEEEGRLIEENSDKVAEYVTRCLMMSVDRRLRLDKIANFRRDFGLPLDFRDKWVHRYPELFKVVKFADEVSYLELVSWNPDWAITELEKNVLGVHESSNQQPGMLSLSFPLKFPSNYKKVYRHREKIDHFQKRFYLSPYADAKGLTAGSLEFDKRAVSVMHELLSFTLEKRLVTDHLTHFRQELVMPQKLMRLLLKHMGIFYVSERGKRFSVFLTEAYEGQELIGKGPLVVWKEKLLSLVGYRGKKKKILTFDDLSDLEDCGLIENSSEQENMGMQFGHEDTMVGVEDALLAGNDEMNIGEIALTDKDSEKS